MPADPLANHRASAGPALASGDAAAIKRLYVQLGADWLDAHAGGGGLDDVPVLSAAETTPVVLAALEGARGRILDAGCGPNPAVSLALGASPARRVVSLDIGWGTVEMARRIATSRGIPFHGVVGDVERLPFRDRSFDGVSCVDCIEHTPDDAAALAELARTARPGGTVVVATPNRRNADVLRRRLRDQLRGVRRPASAYFVSNSHLREYTWLELERLARGPLRVRRREPVGWDRGWKSRVATRLLAARPFREVSQMIVVVAEPR